MTGITVNMMVALVPLLTDSSRNQFTFWGSIHEPIDVAWYGGNTYVAFIHRMWDPASTGYIKMHWSTDNGASWQELVIEDTGLSARYPDATWMVPHILDYPAGSWPELAAGPSWGYMTIGIFNPAGPYFIRSDNYGTHKCNSLVLPDGNILAVGTDEAYIVYVAVADPTDSSWIVEPTAALTDLSFSGIDYDYTNDIIYIFGMNPNTMELEYFTGTWDGVNLNIDPTPNIVPLSVAPPYNVIWWDTWTLRDGTTPVCAVAASTDASENYPRVIYFTDGTSTVTIPTVNPPTDTLQRLVPQLNLVEQTDGNYMSVLWAQVTSWRTDQTYGWAYYDLYLSWSSDNGMTWSTPFNLTETPTWAECLPEAPQHQKGCVLWLGWGREPVDETDIYWDAIVGNDPPLHGLSCHLYLAAACVVGVEEEQASHETFSYRMIGKTLVLSGLPANMKASARVYDILGRELRAGEGTGELRISMDGLVAGAYIFRVEADKLCATGKVIVTR